MTRDARYSATDRAYFGDHALSSIARQFQLTDDEMARLFDTSPAVLRQWHSDGIPAMATSRMSAVTGVAQTLAASINPSELAVWIRQPRGPFAGRSVLEALALDPYGTALQIEQVLSS